MYQMCYNTDMSANIGRFNRFVTSAELKHAIMILLHPSKKVTQHDFDRLYFFYPGFLSIIDQVCYP